jgi:hypothetical protein
MFQGVENPCEFISCNLCIIIYFLDILKNDFIEVVEAMYEGV